MLSYPKQFYIFCPKMARLSLDACQPIAFAITFVLSPGSVTANSKSNKFLNYYSLLAVNT